MKTSLPAKSKDHETRIREISEIIVGAAKDKIAFVILFGSFARGNWLRDRYLESGITYEYASDYDFLVITKTGKQANGSSAFDLERKIKKEIKEVGYLDSIHKTHIVIEPLDRVNDELEKSQYFFSDIKKEGILLYGSGEFVLSRPKELNLGERREIAAEDYEHWFGNAEISLEDCESNLQKSDKDQKYLNKAAFHLHLATECLYNCALLVLTSYKPKSHNLEESNQLCATQSNEFLTVFLMATKEQKDCLKLLQKAYIEARYKKHYKITKEQMIYLVTRVEGLKKLVERLCLERI